MESIAINKKISRNREFKKECTEKRLNVINWSIELPGITEQNSHSTHWVWISEDGIYKVGLDKPGKEFFLNTIRRKDGTKGNNENDMRPVIEKDGKIIDFEPSFREIYKFFKFVLKECGEDVLDELGCMIIRNALMVDHYKIDENYHYLPNKSIVNNLSATIPEYKGIRADVFLHYIDAIAQNEDTKYYTLGNDISKGTGRHNNMLTYVYFIAVLLGKADEIDLCYAYSRPPSGVAPMPMKDVKVAFPRLKIE